MTYENQIDKNSDVINNGAISSSHEKNHIEENNTETNNTLAGSAEVPQPSTEKAKWLEMARAPGTTPMMEQFLTIKADYPDAILFYRMGDFYETFFTDAEDTAKALDIALTKRGKHGDTHIPMAGVPVHAADNYLARLIKKGHKVAVCEQTEDPAEAKKRGSKAVVRREVVRLVTPGTLTEDNLLDARANNYLIALFVAPAGANEDPLKRAASIAGVDMSTGDMSVLPLNLDRLEGELARISPAEILVQEAAMVDEQLVNLLNPWREKIAHQPNQAFSSQSGEKKLKEIFTLQTLDGIGTLERSDLAALAALIFYIEDTQKGKLPALKLPRLDNIRSTVMIDGATRRSLELVRTQTGERKGSLLSSLDITVTGAGARALAHRVTSPMTDPGRINQQLDLVEFFWARPGLRDGLREELRKTPDMERALSRLSLGRGGPRDLLAIAAGLERALKIKNDLSSTHDDFGNLPTLAGQIVSDIGNEHRAIADYLLSALVPEPPLLARDGGFIAPGFDAALDEFRQLRDEGRRLIAALEGRYRDETEINGLKIKHNNVLGYHIDVSAKQAEKLMVPPFSEDFIHRQTLANSVRFSTTELAELAGRISRSADQALNLEQTLYQELSNTCLKAGVDISQTAAALARLDVATSLAELASINNWNRPKIDDSQAFDIRQGRHPVVEKSLKNTGANFVANDCDLGADNRLWLITGPNMAGKSTFLRQNAVIAIMAQMGSFVPAEAAHIGVIDKLFSRVGASDDLAQGRSTFMVEMVETAAILNQAGPRSLVILDEIGRGTATYDGLSIAWAAIEHLHNINQSRALFATHYHELTVLKEKLDHLALRTMKAREWKGEVIFLHEVATGAADRSYGIQVARLAGLPDAVTNRARKILDRLEQADKGETIKSLIDDLPLFTLAEQEKPSTNVPHQDLIDRLDEIHPDILTPRQALDLIYELKSMAESES